MDNFDRPDSSLGLGEGWDLRGDYDDSRTMPAANDGFIRDGAYTYAGASSVYAARYFNGTVRGMGTIGRFRQRGNGDETGIGLGISANDKLTSDMVLLTASPGGWKLKLRRGDVFQPVVMEGQFSPKLEVGTAYQFDFEVTDDTITVRVPGSQVTRKAPIAGLLGDRAFWQEYIDKPPAGDVFDFDIVWAVEDGQPLVPVR